MAIDPVLLEETSAGERGLFGYKTTYAYVPAKEGQEIESVWSKAAELVTLRNVVMVGVTAGAGWVLKCQFACAAAVVLGGLAVAPAVAAPLALVAAGVGLGAAIKLAGDHLVLNPEQKKSQELKDLTLWDWNWIGVEGGKHVLKNAFSGSKSRSIILGGTTGLLFAGAGYAIHQCAACVVPEKPAIVPATPAPTTETTVPTPMPVETNDAGGVINQSALPRGGIIGLMSNLFMFHLTDTVTTQPTYAGSVFSQYFEVDPTRSSDLQNMVISFGNSIGMWTVNTLESGYLAIEGTYQGFCSTWNSLVSGILGTFVPPPAEIVQPTPVPNPDVPPVVTQPSVTNTPVPLPTDPAGGVHPTPTQKIFLRLE